MDLLSILKDKKNLLIILVFTLLIYLDYSFLLQSQLAGLKNAGPKISKLKKDIDTMSADLKRMQELKDKQAKSDKEALAKAKEIISEQGITGLLGDISDLANKNEVKISQMKPSQEPVAPKQDKKASAEKQPGSLLITLDLSADYHSLGKFINDLENAPLYIAVQSLKINSQPGDSTKQKVALVLKSYVKK